MALYRFRQELALPNSANENRKNPLMGGLTAPNLHYPIIKSIVSRCQLLAENRIALVSQSMTLRKFLKDWTGLEKQASICVPETHVWI